VQLLDGDAICNTLDAWETLWSRTAPPQPQPVFVNAVWLEHRCTGSLLYCLWLLWGLQQQQRLVVTETLGPKSLKYLFPCYVQKNSVDLGSRLLRSFWNYSWFLDPQLPFNISFTESATDLSPFKLFTEMFNETRGRRGPRHTRDHLHGWQWLPFPGLSYLKKYEPTKWYYQSVVIYQKCCAFLLICRRRWGTDPLFFPSQVVSNLCCFYILQLHFNPMFWNLNYFSSYIFLADLLLSA